MARTWLLRVVAIATIAGACATLAASSDDSKKFVTPKQRMALLQRSQVWSPTDVSSMDLKAGPPGSDAFQLGETVTCDYVDKKLNGNSPKFDCAIPSKKAGDKPDEVKVKFGIGNAEVYGEIAGTRLLWALGFGADRMYSVRVVCRGCPKSEGTDVLPSGEQVFDPAVIERKAHGRPIESKPDEGWSWDELDKVSAEAGGAPLAHRDALKLLAVFMQHGDNKAQQQEFICAGKADKEDKSESTDLSGCAKPFMLISDLGLTFGRPTLFNDNTKEGVNLQRWAETSVWKKDAACVGNLAKSYTGSLGDPMISEAGRAFLADLLTQLSDNQIHDLFEAARVRLRPSAPGHDVSAPASVDDWVKAFKSKRNDVVTRRCSTGASAAIPSGPRLTEE